MGAYGLQQILENLNAAQKEAVCHLEGPLLVLAGAGSGKTRVLTHRVAYLLSQGVSPGAVLAVTFTNKAAEEMRTRVERLVGPEAARIWVGTFHATCARILRQDGREIGLDPEFAIYDTAGSGGRGQRGPGQAGPEREEFHAPLCAGQYQRGQERVARPGRVTRDRRDFWAKTVARIFPVYREILRRCRALDFDDLIQETVRLFSDGRRSWRATRNAGDTS